LKDKPKAIAAMLPKETEAISMMKDLFSFVTTSFKKDAVKLSEISLAEIGQHLVWTAAEPLIQSHHQQVMVWNDFVNKAGQ
jgi:hypothetical protein